jgi:hypothetical protein
MDISAIGAASAMAPERTATDALRPRPERADTPKRATRRPDRSEPPAEKAGEDNGLNEIV